MKNSAIRAFLTACVLLIILLFSGCGQLIEESEVRETLLAMFPGASVSDAVETKDEEGYTSRVYRVEVNGLSFTVENYQYRENLFGSTAASTRNDLAKSLYQLLRPDLTELAQRRGVTIEEPFGSNLIIKNPIEAYEDTERGLLAFEDALVLADPYLPKEACEWFSFKLVLDTQCESSLQTYAETAGTTSLDYERRLLYFNLADRLRRGVVTDVAFTEENLASQPVKTISALYIDGEPYVSDTYDIRFVYRLEDGKYFTCVCYGTQLVYNGGVNDYLQREILEAYYPDCGYTIEDGVTQYRIGTVEYVVKSTKDGYRFTKNGEELPIVTYPEINRETPGATYYDWMSVQDFALLMGMRVDRVTETGVYLRWQAA